MSNASITNDFIAAWCAMDIDKIVSFFTDDALYTNIPMGPPNVGKENIRTFIEGFLGDAESCDFIVHHQVEDLEKNIVMNERTDKIGMGGRVIELPVMGVFEFRDGKISAWRDYFDITPFTS